MTWLYILVGIVIAIIIAAIVLHQRVNSKSERLASNWAKEIFPVWAALGPFKNGTDSAVAMAYAFITVRGVEFARDQTQTFKQHAEVFDVDPEKWNDVQQTALRSSPENFSKHIEEAIKLRDGTADCDDKKTITAVTIETMLGDDNDKLVDYILDDPK